MAYKLTLPPSTAIHLIFHISQLKQAIGNITQVQPLPPSLTVDIDWEPQPEKVLSSRVTLAGPEVLIQWKDLPPFKATWEPVALIKDVFPGIDLGDKEIFEVEDIDRPGPENNQDANKRPPIKLVYTRKKKRGFPKARVDHWA